MGLQTNLHLHLFFTFYFCLGLKIIWMQEIIEIYHISGWKGPIRIMLYPKSSFFLFVDKVHFFHGSKQRK